MAQEAAEARAKATPAIAAPSVPRPAALPAAILLLFACIVLGTAIGPVDIAPLVVLSVVVNHVVPGVGFDASPTADAIVWQIRLPRVLLAGLVGGTLAYGGAAYQGVFRNPLADPYLLGVAAGAGLAATIVIVSDLPLLYGNLSLVTLAAFGGAMAAVLLTYTLARAGGQTPNTTLILAGVAVSSIAASSISYLMLVNQANTTAVIAWLLGGFNESAWRDMWFILPYTLPAAVLIFLHGRVLNVLQLDEHQAHQLGVNVQRTKVIVLLAASLATAAAVSVAGIIGFVGLVAPHAVRLVAGPDYRRLIPLAALVGASFLILADLGARTLISPSELPVGIITAFVGAPFFLYLLRKQRKAFF
jgi:iron complex transport system permease protein